MSHPALTKMLLSSLGVKKRKKSPAKGKGGATSAPSSGKKKKEEVKEEKNPEEVVMDALQAKNERVRGRCREFPSVFISMATRSCLYRKQATQPGN